MSLGVVTGVVAGVDFGATVGDGGLLLPAIAAFDFSSIFDSYDRLLLL
jgi:hypothetical protein